jgi:L-fuculose-phosphate aldolase
MSAFKETRNELAAAMHRLYQRGLISGVGGNASVLVSSENNILITPSGYFKGGIAEGDLVRVTLDGKVVGPGQPSSELPTHIECYRLRKEIGAVVHAHPPIAVALASATGAIPSITPEQTVLVGNVEIVNFSPPGKLGAEAVSSSLKRANVVGIRNHGFFALGKDLHEAASRLEVLEEAAKIYLAMNQLGKISALSEEEVRKVRELYLKE